MGGSGHNAGCGLAGWFSAAAAALTLVSVADAADAWGNARILYFEPFVTTIDPRPALARKPSTTREVRFEAYGRRFELVLEPNERLQRASLTRRASSLVNLYRGRLDGVPGSWVRFATRGADVHGLVWDGSDLYVIEPGAAVRASLVPPLDVANTRTVVFRLTDTIVDAGARLCSVDGSDVNGAGWVTGAETYESLARELSALKGRDVLMEAAAMPELRLELSAVGDAQFREQFASEAEAIDEMLLRLNNVDGIFAAQLGVEIQVPTTIVFDRNSDPLSPTTSATNLLHELGTLRGASAELRSRGLTHLFTGRDLDGASVGVGYVDGLCHQSSGAALTEIRGRGAWLESLIAAHEIGHNFGAGHDGQGACSAVSSTQFLMSPSVNASHSTFSNCSLNTMRTSVQRASCIVELPPADLAVAADLGTVHSTAGHVFEWPLPVTNLGGRVAQAAHVELHVPPSVDIADAWVAGGACTSGAGTINCELGDVPGGATRTVNLTLSSQVVGSNSIAAHVSSSADSALLNNQGDGTIVIDASADLAVTLQAPATVDLGAVFSVAFSISNTTAIAAGPAKIEFVLPANVGIAKLTSAGGVCTLQPVPTCSLPPLGANSAAAGTLELIAIVTGSAQIEARLAADVPDSNAQNDTGKRSVEIRAVAPARATTRHGAGSIGGLLLIALASMNVVRRRAPPAGGWGL